MPSGAPSPTQGGPQALQSCVCAVLCLSVDLGTNVRSQGGQSEWCEVLSRE